MKIQPLSDLHLEFNDTMDRFTIPDTRADVIALCGDIGMTSNAYFDWVLKQTEGKRAIMVLGNHEAYMDTIDRVKDVWREALKGTHVHFLENDSVSIDGVDFIGSTLWTNFGLLGNEKRVEAMKYADYLMNDYRSIRINKDNLPDDQRKEMPRLSPNDTLEFFNESYHFFKNEMLRIEEENNPNQKTVIVSHHAPSGKSIKHFKHQEIVKAAYASDLTAFILRFKPNLWIHGHLHQNADYRIGNTRVVANPRGYFPDVLNPNFKADLVVEI